ncbi:unnamed protein product [Gongylonema pulchrum]|uniref:NifU_N domain-containing protein n=1 Tax=Gongylonema pulchrum TaxID=637853 RepID=A0A183D2I3_9BILA|nr:unnamed protein product [Gongylonema pulchrum]
MKSNLVRLAFSAVGHFASPLTSSSSSAASLTATAAHCQRCYSLYSPKVAMATEERVLTLETLNPYVINMEYAVRGPLVIRASAIEKELAEVLLKLHLIIIRLLIITRIR